MTNFFRYLWNSLKTVLFSIVSTTILVLVSLLLLLIRLWAFIWKLLHTRNFKQEEEDDECSTPVPEDIFRRPDPCIYSQSYLQSQGIAVTWDNPDIWVAKAVTPTVIEADSYHLLENTHYIVSVQVHNASTDAALGVKVRLVYRPWSFNSPDLVPVEKDANGNEVFKIVNIAAMGANIVTFNWLTPLVEEPEGKHYCIQAILFHPTDTNPNNNLGQENTHVMNVEAAKAYSLLVPLHNPTDKEKQFRITATNYQLDTKATVPLELKKNLGKERETTGGNLLRLVPIIKTDRRRGQKNVQLTWRKPLTTTKAKYVGFEELRKASMEANFPLPEAWQIRINNNNNAISLPPLSKTNVGVNFTVPTDADLSQPFAINVVATDERGAFVGGVTILITTQLF